MKNLGKKIKDIRQSKGVSLRDLAKHIVLTRSFLSQVERGKTSPSIASLEKIAQALGIGLSYFFKEEFPIKFSLFKKKRARKFIIETAKVSCEVLVSDILDIAMVPLVCILGVKEKVGKEQLNIFRKERFIFVQKGKIKLICSTEDKKEFVMEGGDSLYCKCEIPCREMSNIGNKKAVALWVVCAPLV